MSELLALSKLLGGSVHEDNDEELDLDPVGPMANVNPGSIGPMKTNRASKAEPKVASKDIWEADDVDLDDHGAHDDPRPQPEFETIYKQAVSSEDMYLGMGGKDPSSHWCEDMVIRIRLPDHKMSDCELDVTDTFLDLRTPKYRLAMTLQHPVDSANGSAKFDKSKQQLSVTLRMKRDMDFLKA